MPSIFNETMGVGRGGAILESKGLAMAEASHGGRDQANLH